MEVSHFRRNYFRLLLALVVLGMLYPMLELRGERGRIWGLVAWTLSFWAVLLVALRAIFTTRRGLLLARVLLITALGLGGLSLLVDVGAETQQFGSTVHAGAWLVSLLFLVQTTWALLRDVAAEGKVDANRIWGAVCVYILMALCFAKAYALLEWIHPGSLELRGHGTSGAAASMSLMLYYSFVTITTLGYGDVLPMTPVARLFAGAEALMGQLYLTVVVARLVGLHISHARHGPEPDDL